MYKEYTAKNLINNSRYVRFILHVPVSEIERLCVRLEEIIAENEALCTAENFPFMSNAATALVLFERFRNQGKSFQEAYFLSAQPMWDYCEGEAYIYYKKSRSKKVLGKISRKLQLKLEKNYAQEWNIKILKADEEGISLKCTKCFYVSFFKRYGLEAIAAMFCYADGIVYGSMQNTDFNISSMLLDNKQECEINFISKVHSPRR